jgi:hypothetical protein
LGVSGHDVMGNKRLPLVPAKMTAQTRGCMSKNELRGGAGEGLLGFITAVVSVSS